LQENIFMKEEKRKIDIITENNFKEVSSIIKTGWSIVFNADDKVEIVYNADYKLFTYLDDEFLFETGTTLKAYYHKKYEDIDNEFNIYKANRLVFEGKIDTEEEFKILLKMLSL
jgi:hypothetical protein